MKRLIFALVLSLGLCMVSGAGLAQDSVKVLMQTTAGDMVIELYPDRAPDTVANFLHYVRSGFYDGTIFHRVVDGFVIQGGGLTESMEEKPTDLPIMNEAANGLRNEPYTVAMARTSSPHSATSQFFINLKNNRMLDYTSSTGQGWGYCVFGRVIQGQEVVDEIGRMRTIRIYPHDNVPVPAVVILHAEVIQ